MFGCDHPTVTMSALVIVIFGVPLTATVMVAVDPRATARRAGRRLLDQRVRRFTGATTRSSQLPIRISRWTVGHRRVLWLAVAAYWLATVAVLAEIVAC